MIRKYSECMKHTWSRGNCVPVRQVVSETEVVQWEVCFRTRQLTSRLRENVVFIDMDYG